MSRKGLMAVEALSDISKFLNASKPPENHLDNALRILGTSTSAVGVALYKKVFTDQVEFTLKCLGVWNSKIVDRSSEDWYLDISQVKRFPGEWWPILEADEILQIDHTSSLSFKRSVNLTFIPILIEGNLFGFLCLKDSRGCILSASRRIYLKAVSRIFELWVSKLNITKRLNDYLDSMPTPVLVMDGNGVVTGWNRPSEEMTGWRAEEILGKGDYAQAIPYYGEPRPTVSNLILNPDPEWEAGYLEFRRVENSVYSLSYCPGVPGGGAFVSCKTSKIFDINNRLWGTVHTVRDVNRERQIEKNLQRSESMYRTIANFAGVGIMLFRRNRVLYCNEQFLKFIGKKDEEICLDDLVKWIHPHDRTETNQRLDNLFEGIPTTDRFEFRAQSREGSRYYRCNAAVMDYEDQPTVHLILDDITEQKELAHKARLNELRMYHDDRLTALGTMAAGIAHELNQPLNTIRVITDGFLFGREEGWVLDHEELYDNLEMVSKQVLRMSDVIQNIRNFAREDRGQNEDDVDPNDAVQNVFSMIGRQIEVHGIQVKKYLLADIPPIKANLNRLEQVVMNLIVNARQALDDCSHDSKELWVRTGKEDGHIFIEVGDNATGIPEPFLTKVFDPFFTTKEVGQGTGLGLTISQTIMSEFKGRIEAFNNSKGGATFLVTAPVSGGRR
ncbi:MAG: PAS domain S-box protein [Deltaproteobacteria bacterium]|nr:PAS domain S-box protein [Deltaproteobacteria bacterium]